MRLIKMPRPDIALKRPKAQHAMCGFCLIQQARTDPLSLCVRKDVKLLDPVLTEGDDADKFVLPRDAPDAQVANR
jgi:hypothetical protein